LKHFYEAHQTDQIVPDRRVLTIVRRVVELQPRRIVDLACGRGLLMELLRERLPDAEIVGGDISELAASEARARGFEVYVVEVQKPMPFPSAHFDCAILGEVIEHLIDPDAAFVQVSTVLRSDGHLVLSTPNLASWFNRILLLFGIQPVFTETSLHVKLGRRWRALGQWGPPEGHLKIFTLGALREMLTANGYRTVRVDGVPFPGATTPAVVDRFFSLFPNLASNFVVVALNSGQRASRYPLGGAKPRTLDRIFAGGCHPS
jgi:SAM-dependent methyltransferase